MMQLVELKDKLIQVCESIEKRFNEVAKKTNLIHEVWRYSVGHKTRLHALSRLLHYMSASGTVSPRLFKYYSIKLFVLNWLGGSVSEGFIKIISEEEGFESKIRYVEDFIRTFYHERASNILNLLDYYRVLGTTPIASRIFYAYLSRYSSREKREYVSISTPYVYPGSRIILSGELGSGKTTIAFASLYSFFRALNYNHEEALKYTFLFFSNALPDSFIILATADDVASEGLLIPAVIIDDAGATISKYDTVPYLTDKKTLKLTMMFTKYFQISREGIGCKVIITTPDMAPKGIRTTADSVIMGYSLREREVYTLWIERKNFLRPMYKPRDDYTPPIVETVVIRNATGTVHPPLVPPTAVSKALTDRKLEYRKKILEEMAKLISSEEADEEAEEGSTEASH